MTFYIQYNDRGEIVATVQSSGKPPVHPRQIALNEAISINNKKVNIFTKEIEDSVPTTLPEVSNEKSYEDRIAELESKIAALEAAK